MYANWRAMKTLALRSLNFERSKLLIRGFLTNIPDGAFVPTSDQSSLAKKIHNIFDNTTVLSTNHIGKQEPIIEPLLPRFLRSVEKVDLNSDLAQIMTKIDFEQLKASIDHYIGEKYILCPAKNGKCVYALMKTGSTPVDRLKALFEGYATILSKFPKISDRETVSNLFGAFMSAISLNGWNTDRILLHGPQPKYYSVMNNG